MHEDEVAAVCAALGLDVPGGARPRRLAGGFSHDTSRLDTPRGPVVVRLGGGDLAIERAVMDAARAVVPVPRVERIVPAPHDGVRAAMVLEHVGGALLADVLAAERDPGALAALGDAVGRTAADVGRVRFARPGFVADADLALAAHPPWSREMPAIVDAAMARVPAERLDAAERAAWRDLCAAHAPALAAVDDHARLVHADLNPKNVLVAEAGGRWTVEALLDWEFAYAGCPWADAANMVRFDEDDDGVLDAADGGAVPRAFRDAFLGAVAAHRPPDLPSDEHWLHRGRVLDMIALSDLVTRRPGHVVADRAARRIRALLAAGTAG